MSDRDRLIELLEQAKEKAKGTLGSMNNGFGAWYADYLLANGVTVSPVPIGSTVYEIRARGRRTIMWSSRKCDYSIINDGYFENAKAHDLEFYIREKSFVKADCSRWNKTVFATKEEAEKMLKELTNESQNK